MAATVAPIDAQVVPTSRTPARRLRASPSAPSASRPQTSPATPPRETESSTHAPITAAAAR